MIVGSRKRRFNVARVEGLRVPLGDSTNYIRECKRAYSKQVPTGGRARETWFIQGQ